MGHVRGFLVFTRAQKPKRDLPGYWQRAKDGACAAHRSLQERIAVLIGSREAMRGCAAGRRRDHADLAGVSDHSRGDFLSDLAQPSVDPA